MANSASHAALPYPVKGARFTIPVPYLDADGDPTDPTTPDTEISEDGGAFTDCAEEVTTISGSNGAGYLTLTGAELDCSLAVIAAKVASGPKATLITLQPRVLPVLYSGTAAAGAAGTITLASDVPAITSLLIGAIVKTTGGTGGGGTGGANNQARVITAYNSSRVATVVPNWETTPSTDTTYEILLTENCLMRYSNEVMIQGDAQSTTDLKDLVDAGYDPSTNKIQGVVLTDTVTTYTGNTPQTGDAYAIVNSGTFGNSAINDKIGTPSDLGGGATLSANLSDIESQTDDIGVAGAGLTAITSLIDTEVGTIVSGVASIIATLGTNGDGLTDIPWNAAWSVEVEDATWDATLADHLDSGSTGAALNAAGSAGDPWNTALPGAYGAGSAGFIIGTNIDTAISSRASQSSVDTIDNLVDDLESRLGTPSNLGGGATIAANLSDIESQTDDIGAAGVGLTAITTFIDTEVAAILAAVDTEVGSILTAVDTEIATILTRIGTPTNFGSGADLAGNFIDMDGRIDNIEGSAIAIEAVLGTPSNLGSGANLSSNLVDIEAQTDDIGVAGAGLTAIPWNAAWDVQVESGVDDALIAKGLDHLVFTSVVGADIADNSIIARMASKSATADWDSFDNTTDSLQGIRDSAAGGGGDITSIDGSTAAATSAKDFFTTGYGPLIWRGTVGSVNSQTDDLVDIAISGSAEPQSYLGLIVVVRRAAEPLDLIWGLVQESTDVNLVFVPKGGVDMPISASDIVEILPPSFVPTDREHLLSIGTGTGDGGDVESPGGVGAAVLSSRISYSSLTPDNFLEIIQGEEKTITFLVEANGRFEQTSADEIRIALRDPEDNEVLIEDEDIERVCEELDVQVIRATLSPEQTYELTEGLLRIEVKIDNQKARLSHALKIIEGILGT